MSSVLQPLQVIFLPKDLIKKMEAVPLFFVSIVDASFSNNALQNSFAVILVV